MGKQLVTSVSLSFQKEKRNEGLKLHLQNIVLIPFITIYRQGKGDKHICRCLALLWPQSVSTSVERMS